MSKKEIEYTLSHKEEFLNGELARDEYAIQKKIGDMTFTEMTMKKEDFIEFKKMINEYEIK